MPCMRAEASAAGNHLDLLSSPQIILIIIYPCLWQTQGSTHPNRRRPPRLLQPTTRSERSFHTATSITMLWVDKHRPTRLQQLSYHGALTQRLSSLASEPGGLPHLLFYGPPGSGKKTRIMSLLRQVFGPGTERLRLDKRTFTTPTKRTVEINMISSNYHIEMAPGDAGLNDRYVIQDVIKEMAQSKNIASVGSNAEAGGGGGAYSRRRRRRRPTTTARRTTKRITRRCAGQPTRWSCSSRWTS